MPYGRFELKRDGKLASSDDIPINPGESYVFKISEQDRKGLEGRLANVRRVGIRVYSISFGDGTGFKAGVAFP
ncbi:MAG: hypothetical protein WAV20_03950 [Blastocatellia bacterium]